MKPLPDLADMEAMAARGRRAALISARNEAAEAVRTTAVMIQSADFDGLPALAAQLRPIADRLEQVSALWESL